MGITLAACYRAMSFEPGKRSQATVPYRNPAARFGPSGVCRVSCWIDIFAGDATVADPDERLISRNRFSGWEIPVKRGSPRVAARTAHGRAGFSA
jgi:hypothetical protein